MGPKSPEEPFRRGHLPYLVSASVRERSESADLRPPADRECPIDLPGQGSHFVNSMKSKTIKTSSKIAGTSKHALTLVIDNHVRPYNKDM